MTPEMTFPPPSIISYGPCHVIYYDRPSERGFIASCPIYIKVANSLKQIVIEEAVLIQESTYKGGGVRVCNREGDKARAGVVIALQY